MQYLGLTPIECDITYAEIPFVGHLAYQIYPQPVCLFLALSDLHSESLK